MKSKIDTRPYPGKGGDTIIVTPVATDSIMYEMNTVLPKVDVPTVSVDLSMSWWDYIIQFLSDNVVTVSLIIALLIGVLTWYLYKWYNQEQAPEQAPPQSTESANQVPVEVPVDVTGIDVVDVTEVSHNEPITVNSVVSDPVAVAVATAHSNDIVTPVAVATTATATVSPQHTTSKEEVSESENEFDEFMPYDPMFSTTSAFVDAYTMDTEDVNESEEESANESEEEAEVEEAIDAIANETEESEEVETPQQSKEIPKASNIRSLFGGTPTVNSSGSTSNKCVHILTKGDRTGQPCGKDTAAGRSYCYNHNRK
jgi:hypothetical protein